jgi:multicomponent Na+:H+ antiporter subunit F
MNAFLIGVAAFILAMVGLGLVRMLRGPGEADRTMAVQLLGTGGVAILLLQGVAADDPALFDVALILALLAAFTSVALAKGAEASRTDGAETGEEQ